MAERRLPPVEDLEAALRDLARPHRSSADVLTCPSWSWPDSRRPTCTAAARVGRGSRSRRPCSWSSCSLPCPEAGGGRLAGHRRGPRRPHRATSPPAPAPMLRLGHEVSLDEASDRAPFTILGPVDAWGRRPPSTWASHPPTPSRCCGAEGTGVPGGGGHGRRRAAHRDAGIHRRALIEKQLGPGTTLETATVGDDAAYWIAGGQHELLYLDRDGRTRPDTTRLAANTLLWEHDGVTFRLESGLDRDAAVDLAGDLEPLP